jgi:hypothetical protein
VRRGYVFPTTQFRKPKEKGKGGRSRGSHHQPSSKRVASGAKGGQATRDSRRRHKELQRRHLGLDAGFHMPQTAQRSFPPGHLPTPSSSASPQSYPSPLDSFQFPGSPEQITLAYRPAPSSYPYMQTQQQMQLNIDQPEHSYGPPQMSIEKVDSYPSPYQPFHAPQAVMQTQFVPQQHLQPDMSRFGQSCADDIPYSGTASTFTSHYATPDLTSDDGDVFMGTPSPWQNSPKVPREQPAY